MKIDEFVGTLWHSRHFKMSIIELNQIYGKIRAEALDQGLGPEIVRDSFDALDSSLSYDEAFSSLMASLRLRDCPRKIEPLDARTCPRCGARFNYIETRDKNGHIYYYAVHRSKDEKRKLRVHKCYLGAKAYEYVKRLHEDSDLPLTGAQDKGRYVEYLEIVLGHLASNELDSAQKERVRSILRQYKGEF